MPVLRLKKRTNCTEHSARTTQPSILDPPERGFADLTAEPKRLALFLSQDEQRGRRSGRGISAEQRRQLPVADNPYEAAA